MIRALSAALVLAPFLAFAQDMATYNRALSAYNSGSYDEAIRSFYEISENATEVELRTKSEYYLAQSFQKKGLPVTALVYYTGIVKAGKAHPFYLKGVEGLVNIQQQLDDQELIPNFLNNEYNPDEWATLPLEVLSRINYLVGMISQRKTKLEEAKSFLDAVEKTSAVHAKAQYLIGIVLVDPRYPGGPQVEPAIKAFETVLNTTDARQIELTQTQHLALLALGRTYYGTGQYQKATEVYERIPRYSKYWDVALFENGFARFGNDDFGGALGSLQALHAPQFAGAFQPESWYLKSIVYFYSCLYAEAKTALAGFDEIYLPMGEKLKALLESEEKDPSVYFKLINEQNAERLPKPVINWVRGNERMLGVFGLLRQIDQEKTVIAGNTAWQGSKLGADLTTYLDQNRGTLIRIAGQFSRSRLVEAQRMIKNFADNGEIVRFETAKAEKELAEVGIDQGRLLAKQTLYRPAMPAENWNYWKFQGEFWIDEIGYYQYTLKKGCPERQAE